MHTLQRSVPTTTDAPRPARASQQCRVALASLLAGLGLSVATAAHAKPFMDYIKPQPQVAPLSDATWGDPGVIPRDISNGIESTKGKGVHPEYYYWDGQIIKAKDGKYHMFMSTFGANTNFGTGWFGSDVFHAISETNVLGPYKRQDYVYPASKGGHNVSAVELPDGGYAVIASETIPFTIYQSTSLDGPWTKCTPQSDVGKSNISLWPRHDGKFEITERSGQLAISDTLCGHYVKQTPKTTYSARSSSSIYPAHTSIPGVSNPSWAYEEDPHIWRSGGTYHIIYSGSGDRVGWHVYSPDGLTGWKDNGYAWSPRDYKKIFCYEDSTHCDAWYKMERPSVVLQDGHPTHITWAVADVDKDNQVLPGTNHGTKVVVIPFDGVAFDNDFGDGKGGSGGSTGTGGTTGSGGMGGTAGARGGSTATGGTSANGGSSTGVSSSSAGGSAGGGGEGGTTKTTSGTGTGGKTSTGGSAGSSSSSVAGGAGAGGSVTSAATGGSSSRTSTSSTPTGGSSSGGASSSAGASSSSSSLPVATGGKSGNSSSATSTASEGDSEGCNCAFGSAKRRDPALPGLLLGVLGMILVGRRKRTRR